MECHRSPSMHIKRSQAASVCHKSSKKHYREQCPEWKRCLHWPAGTMSRRTDLKKLLSFPDILSPCVSQRRLICCFGPFALRGSEKDCKSLNQTRSFASLKHFSTFRKMTLPTLELEGEASNLADGQQNTGRFDCNFPCWELIEGLLPLINPARIGDLCPVEGRIQRQIHNPRGNAFVSPQQPSTKGCGCSTVK